MTLLRRQTKGIEIVYFLLILLCVLLYLDYKKFNNKKTTMEEKNESLTKVYILAKFKYIYHLLLFLYSYIYI